jgi:hypothetical protein
MANNDKDCYDLMNEAYTVLEWAKKYSSKDYNFEHYLGQIRSSMEYYVGEVKAGKSIDGWTDDWDFLLGDALDNMLSGRLAEMPRFSDLKGKNMPKNVDEDDFDFEMWDDKDFRLFKTFELLTEIMHKIVEMCKPENDNRIAASRAAKGLPNVATRTAANAAARNAAARNEAARNAVRYNEAQKVWAKAAANGIANVGARAAAANGIANVAAREAVASSPNNPKTGGRRGKGTRGRLNRRMRRTHKNKH